MNLKLRDNQITINGLVSYCKCRCRHCLLCSGSSLLQPVPFEKLKRLALKFAGFYERTGIDAALCVYNCADYPQLPEAMEVDRQISKYSGYQNLNGTPIREGKELSDWVAYLKNTCGVTHANLSWFGTEAYHDYFVQRKGYFHYLLDLAKELQIQNIPYHNSILILKSNLGQLEELYSELETLGGKSTFAIPHYRGYAKNLLSEFLGPEDLKRIPKFIFQNGLCNIKRNKLVSEWVETIANGKVPELTNRNMLLVANPENIDACLQMSCDEIIGRFHEMDEKLQRAVPDAEYLAKIYGKKENVLIDYRSLLWRWTDLYFDGHPGLDQSLLFSDLHTSVMWR